MARITRVESKRRELRALELRVNGLTLKEVGEELGMTKSGASRLVKRAMDKLPMETAGLARQLELFRLDAMGRGLWDRATSGEPKAILAMLAIMDRRARLLGLDKPALENHEIVIRYENDWRRRKVEERPEGEVLDLPARVP